MAFKFETFDTWQRAITWANDLFDVADALPKQYQFSLADQLRRAALSVPTNLAEGSGRDNVKERQYFYRIATGSVYEVVSLLVMIGKRGHLTREAYRRYYQEADELAAMITAAAVSKTLSSSSSPL